MPLSADDFWNQLRASGLIPEPKLEQLHSRIGAKPSIANSPVKIAKALIANKFLTESQARRILAGETIAPPVSESLPQADDGPRPKNYESNQRKSRLPLILSLCVPTLLLLGGLWLMNMQSGPPTNDSPSTEPVNTAAINPVTRDAELPYELVDSADALWARPEFGQPIELPYAPAGVQAIVHVRLAELLAHSEGQKILRSLGPGVSELLSKWLARIHVGASDVETLDLHLLPQGTTLPLIVAVVKLQTASLQDVVGFDQKNANGIARLATDAIWFPPNESRTFVFGKADVVVELSEESSILRRELEQLRLATHDTDHVTLLANPNFLRDEAQGLFPGTKQRLLEGLYDFWSEESQAVSLGLQLSETALVEVRMIARENLQPRRLAAILKRKLNALATKTSDFLGRAELDSHWQPLALRFPAMVRFATSQTRLADEGKQVAFNTALPVESLHNLLLASELSFSSTMRDTTTAPIVDRSTWTLDRVLAHSMNVRFEQKSLEVAIRDIAQDVRDELTGLPFQFEIEIVGTDLEPEGITRNQQIRNFAESNRTLSNVLTALAMKANPDQSVTSASDESQKLVWLIDKTRAGRLLLSTRAAANARQIELPSAFR